MQCTVQHDNAIGFLTENFEYCKVYIGFEILDTTKKVFLAIFVFQLASNKSKESENIGPFSRKLFCFMILFSLKLSFFN